MSEQRLIDANELIPLIKMGECNMYDEYCQGRNGGIAYAIERINQMPTIEPEQHWIPCSERLPGVGQDVLFSVGDLYVSEGCLRDDGDWSQFRWQAIQRKESVTAWMPLPQPYKEADHE